MEFEKLNAEERLVAEQAVLNFRSLNKACDDRRLAGNEASDLFEAGTG